MGGSLNFNHLLFLGQGALWTIGLSLIGLIGGGIFGFIIALCRISPVRMVRIVSAGYVQLIQGTPLLVIMFLDLFRLAGARPHHLAALRQPALHSQSTLRPISEKSGVAACSRSPRAQWEAAEGLALSRWQRMMKVILPQAVRIATPPTVGFMVQIIKNTSLASVVGFVELARSGQIINNSLFEPFLIYSIIAVIYFALCYPVSRVSRRLESRRRPGAAPSSRLHDMRKIQAEPTNSPVVSLKNVHKSFGKLKVLDGVDFTVDRGEVLAVIGRSGSGKSTALRCIDRFETIDSGEIVVCGHRVERSGA